MLMPCKNSGIKMEIGFIGLGRMGSRLAYRLLDAEHSVIGYDPAPQLENNHIKLLSSASEVIRQTSPRRLCFVMVPAANVDSVLADIKPCLNMGDVIVDAGNSFYKDSVRRCGELEKIGVSFLDAGTSGGLEGAANGANFVVGGSREAFEFAMPAFQAMASEGGILYTGRSGTGHFVKMVHNAIEYGMLEAYAEGFDLLKSEGIDVARVSKTWEKGSVVCSWLLELITRCLERDAELKDYTGKIGGGESGGWAISEAESHGIGFSAIQSAQAARKESAINPSYASKLISALREEFGGHKEPK